MPYLVLGSAWGVLHVYQVILSMLPIPLPDAGIAYACGCGVLLEIEVPSTDHIGFGEVDCKSMQLDEDWEFFYFLIIYRALDPALLLDQFLFCFTRFSWHGGRLKFVVAGAFGIFGGLRTDRDSRTDRELR